MLGMLRRRVPWLMVFEAARLAHGHLMQVTSPEDRRLLNEMLRRTKGRPQQLTAQDKQELRRIGGQLDMRGFARSAGPSMVLGRKLGRR